MLYKIPRLTPSEQKVLQDIAGVREKMKNRISAPKRWIGLLRRNAIARAIQASNSIEGYNVNDEDAIAAAEGEELLEAERESRLAVVSYRTALTFVLQLASDPHFVYNDGFIRSLNFMMLNYDLSKKPGRWRVGPIYVRDEKRHEVVYEGPDADLVPELVAELIGDLNDKHKEPAMIRAAMSHLNLVLIHPFLDGNGRMARCLQTLVLVREGILEPEFCSIEENLGHNTQEYYAVLGRTAKGAWTPKNDARSWIRFCLTAHYRQGQTLLRRTNEITRLWDEIEALIKKVGLPERMMFALTDAAMGLKVRNATYRVAADISDNLASRDLKTLINQRLLVPDGENRGRLYRASDVLKRIRTRTREPKAMADPKF
jgi:Fic family protein